MDARGKFGEHERCVRVARGDSRGGGGGGSLNFRGGEVRKEQSPDFRSPEVGISVLLQEKFS